LAEPPVSVVDKVVKKRGTQKVAEAYLQFLYTDAGQEIAAKHYFRPRAESIAQKNVKTFPKLSMFTIDEVFGGWQKAQKIHFNDGGLFDEIFRSRR
jgi:sulfate transport system substrate-binding protein